MQRSIESADAEIESADAEIQSAESEIESADAEIESAESEIESDTPSQQKTQPNSFQLTCSYMQQQRYFYGYITCLQHRYTNLTGLETHHVRP